MGQEITGHQFDTCDFRHFAGQLREETDLLANPQPLAGDGLGRMVREFAATWDRCRDVGVAVRLDVVSIGALPTVTEAGTTSFQAHLQASPVRSTRCCNAAILASAQAPRVRRLPGRERAAGAPTSGPGSTPPA